MDEPKLEGIVGTLLEQVHELATIVQAISLALRNQGVLDPAVFEAAEKQVRESPEYLQFKKDIMKSHGGETLQ